LFGSISDWHLLQVTKLRKERDSKEEDLEVFIKVTPAQLWDNDLEEFLRAWRVCADVDHFTRLAQLIGMFLCQNILDSDEARGKVTTTKGKKRATLKTRKSIGFGKSKKKESDDDDDFSDFAAPKARKTAASSGAPKPRAPKGTSGPAKADMDAGDGNPRPSKKPAASGISDDNAPVVVQKPKAKARSMADDVDSKGKGKNAGSTKRKK
jgi:DNA topoisomerase-2